MKRIEVSYGGGFTTCLLDLKSNLVYAYELCEKQLHEEFGGKQYYQSHSGRSAEGWIEARPWLVEIGCARLSCNEQTGGGIGGKSVWAVYDRAELHGLVVGHRLEYSFVFVKLYGTENKGVYRPAERWDGDTSDTFTLAKLLGGSWAEVPWRKNVPVYYASEYANLVGGRIRLEYLCVSLAFAGGRFKGVDIRRFLDLDHARCCSKEVDGRDFSSDFNESFFSNRLRWKEKAEGAYLHRNDQLGFYDDAAGLVGVAYGSVEGQPLSDPRRELARRSGWEYERLGDNAYFCYRAKEGGIEAFIEGGRGSRYAIEGSPYCEFEQDFTLLEFFADFEDAKKQMSAALLRKKRGEWLHAQGEVDVNATVERNGGLVVCLQDSYDAGNCVPGTRDFLERQGIAETEATVAELASKYPAALKDGRFVRVLAHAVKSKGGELVTAGGVRTRKRKRSPQE